MPRWRGNFLVGVRFLGMKRHEAEHTKTTNESSHIYFKSVSMSLVVLPGAGRVNFSPYFVKPGTKPPFDRKNWPFSDAHEPVEPGRTYR